MRKKRYPPGERKDRIDALLKYIASNPGCRMIDIQTYMNWRYKSTLSPKITSEYLKDLLFAGAIREKRAVFHQPRESRF